PLIVRETMRGSIISSPRGLASFLANHPINDLVPMRLLSTSDLAAEILELWAGISAPRHALASLTVALRARAGLLCPSIGRSSGRAIATKRTASADNAAQPRDYLIALAPTIEV
ncbi:MAG TPA: hypothetical protein VGE93_03125, partial [Bryobacteraceae bacterium]